MIRCEKCGKVFADQRGVTQVRVVGGARWYCSSFRACKTRQSKRGGVDLVAASASATGEGEA